MKNDMRLQKYMGLVALGYSTRAELVWRLSELLGHATVSGTVNRTAKIAEQSGLVHCENVRLFRHGQVQMVRLTDAGESWCVEREIFPEVGDWDLMRRFHDGDNQPRHTAAVLMFAYQARRRGWTASVMPYVVTMRRRLKWEPDIKLCDFKTGQSVYCEVETRARYAKVEEGKFAKAMEGCHAMDSQLGVVGLMPYAADKFRQWLPGEVLVTDLSSLCQGQDALWRQGYQAKGDCRE